jgi:hypothetical protein
MAPDWLYELVLRPKEKSSTAAATPPHINSFFSFGKSEFWRKVNSIAFQRLDAWVPEIFGRAARFEPGTGAYRISSRDLGRDLEEDLSISPLGAKDWGVWDIGDAKRGKRSAIDIVIEYGGKRDATEAALWLCERCGVDPATLGWNSARQGGQSADDGESAGSKAERDPRSKTAGQDQQGAHGTDHGAQQSQPGADKDKSGAGNSGGPTAPANSEEFLALIFIDRHEADLRFVAKWGQWFRWDGSRWALEETLHAFDMARLICREAANACNKSGAAKTLASAKTVAAVERLAKADRKLAATFWQWDTDADKFNTSQED